MQTIKLGYANAKIYKCPVCPKPSCYQARGSATRGQPECDQCDTPMTLMRHISFVGEYIQIKILSISKLSCLTNVTDALL